MIAQERNDLKIRFFLLFAVLAGMIGLGHCQDLPDAPTPQAHQQTAGPKFFQFRGADDPPNATNKQVFHSKLFIATHVAYAVAVFYDIHHTHGAREKYDSELPAIPAIVGMDYIAYRLLSPSLSIEAPIYAIVHYSMDAAK